MFLDEKNIEYFSTYSNAVLTAMVAFSNSSGGIIYVGMDRKGKCTPIENLTGVMRQIQSDAKKIIAPRMNIMVKNLLTNKIIKISVGEGIDKPYFIREKGICPAGVSIYSKGIITSATHKTIAQMIENSSEGTYETEVSTDQSLSFSYLNELFEKSEIHLNDKAFVEIGIKNGYGLYTKLGMLLSEQCSHSTKVVIYSDPERTEVIKQYDFQGSVLRQYTDLFNYIFKGKHTRPDLIMMQNSGKYSYSKDAIREALVNSLIHRDYSIDASTIISLTPVDLEFLSVGDAPRKLKFSEFKAGIVHLRNKKLANVFRMLKLADLSGVGISRIIKAYSKYPLHPKFELTENSFKVTIPDMTLYSKSAQNNPSALNSTIIADSQNEIICKYLAKYGTISNKQAMELLNLKQTRVHDILARMQQQGIISQIGKGLYIRSKLPSIPSPH